MIGPQSQQQAHQLLDSQFEEALEIVKSNLEDSGYVDRLLDMAHDRIDLGFATYGGGIWEGSVEDEDYPRMDILEELADVIVYYMVGIINGKDMASLLPAKDAKPMPQQELKK